MKKQYILYIGILLLSSLLLTGCTKKDTTYDTSKIEIVDDKNNGEELPEVEDTEIDEEKVGDDLGYLSNPDEFTKTKQSIGEESSAEYTILPLDDVQSNGYHVFNFNISSSTEDAPLPLFTVDPILDKGVYRVTVKNVVKDESGIAYQQSKVVNKGAITGIYRAVTSIPNTAIYEIGFLANNPFKLDYIENDLNSWKISVKVAYDLSYSPPTIDFGSSEFSNTEQKIVGMMATDGAKISSYSYSVTGGTLKFVYSVASGTSNPIPTVEAKYDDMNILHVTFTSLSSDKVSGWGSTITLPSGIVVNVARAGEVSTYSFGGIGAAKPFRLSATQSPNQVILEVKL